MGKPRHLCYGVTAGRVPAPFIMEENQLTYDFNEVSILVFLKHDDVTKGYIDTLYEQNKDKPYEFLTKVQWLNIEYAGAVPHNG